MADRRDQRRRAPSGDEEGFREWMAARSPALRRKGYLMSGDWHAADDLVQDTLIALYARWSRVARGGNVDAYANRVLVHKYIDSRRRPWRREHAVDAVPESADESALRAFRDVDGTDDLLSAALVALPPGQRAVVVLRYTDDLAVGEIARLMDLPGGTVKSRLSRGSEAIRRHLERHGHPRALSSTRTPITEDQS